MIGEASANPEGCGRPGPCPRPGGRAHEGGMGGLGSARMPSRTRPPARRSWSLASRFGVLHDRCRSKAALSASARTRVFHRDGRGRRQDAGRRAHDRAGDREAENPEAPPCEDGLSAASTESRSRDPRPPPRTPLTSSTGEPLRPKPMPPRFRTPPEAPLRGRDGRILERDEFALNRFGILESALF